MSAECLANERFNVFKVRYGPVLADPDMPGTRYHTALFVETSADSSGYIHHVTGDLVTGMRYEFKLAPRPETSITFHSKELVGTILRSLHPTSMAEVCRAIPAPPRQKAFNLRSMKTEPIKPDGSFYEPGEPRPALVKCTEWTENRAIPTLLERRIVERLPATSTATNPSSGPVIPSGSRRT